MKVVNTYSRIVVNDDVYKAKSTQDVRFRNLLVSDLKRLLLLYRKNSARSYFFLPLKHLLRKIIFSYFDKKICHCSILCSTKKKQFFPKPFGEKTAFFNLHVFPPIQNSFPGRTSEPDDSWWNIFARGGHQHQDQQLSKGKQVLLLFSELLAFLHLNLSSSSSRDSPFLICPPSGTARPQSLYSRQPTPQGPNPPNS